MIHDENKQIKPDTAVDRQFANAPEGPAIVGPPKRPWWAGEMIGPLLLVTPFLAAIAYLHYRVGLSGKEIFTGALGLMVGWAIGFLMGVTRED